MRIVIAVCLAVIAAAFFGLGSVLEQQTSRQVPVRQVMSPHLFLDLVTRPLFAAAVTVDITGTVLQIFALHFGSLTLVQPILVLSLLFAVLTSAFVLRRRPPDRVMMIGVLCCAAGIGSFLAIARPTHGSGTVGVDAAPLLLIALATFIIACVAAARLGPPRFRALWLALAGGIDVGVNAFLLKVIPGNLRLGFTDPLRQWPLYLVFIVAPAGFLLTQNAFQVGILIAPVLAVITTTNPLVSIVLGRLMLHETIASSAVSLAGEAVSLAMMTAGVIALAHRAPHVVQQMRAEPRSVPGGVPSPYSSEG